MPQMIMHGKDLIRICPKDNTILEYSNNQGATWKALCFSSRHYLDLMDSGNEILATTDIGLLYSADGRSWRVRSFK